MVSLFATIAAWGPFNIYGYHQGHPPGFSGGASIGAVVETVAVVSAVVSSQYLFVAKWVSQDIFAG